jgi:RHS repeat-associated protein
MSGGQDGSSVNDSGTITLTVNGHSDSASYGSSSTPPSLASALAIAINNDTNAAVTAVATGYVVSLTTKASGAGANYALTLSSQSNNPPNAASFSMSSSGPSMVGGTGGYGYALLYAPNGNMLAANDSANGNWTFSYDDFNRLTGSACSLHCPDSQNTQGFSYAYDRYANRWQQNLTAGSGPAPSASFSGNNNRMDGYSYDGSGNLLNDGTHSYTYDAESRIIKVDSGSTATYVYDAEGRRVQKTSAAGTVSYLYDLAGHQMNELNSSGGLNREEIYAGGHHLATYANGTTIFDHADWIGTERARSGLSGSVCESIVSLPFGDGQSTSGSCGDPSPMHFTGKQRDTETNLDDFDARYYSSTLGRFISADWSAVPTAVPYAHLSNPQTLNLYAIVSDNVESFADLDGHDYRVQGDLNGTAPDWNTMNVAVHLHCPGCEVEGENQSGSGNIADTENGIFATYTYYVPDPAQQGATAAKQQSTNAQVRANIAAAALSYDGSSDWATDARKDDFGPGSNKCNKFVYDVTKEAGATAQVKADNGNTRPPLAGEWANPKTEIKNWRVLKPEEAPQPGDVAAYKIGQGNTPNATGHSGIVVGGPNGTTRTISAHSSFVGPPSDQFLNRQDTVYRRYTGQ